MGHLLSHVQQLTGSAVAFRLFLFSVVTNTLPIPMIPSLYFWDKEEPDTVF